MTISNRTQPPGTGFGFEQGEFRTGFINRFRERVVGDGDNLNRTGTSAVVLNGSVARDRFFPGWSDIDLVVIGQRAIDTDTLKIVSDWKTDEERTIGTKVGIDFINEDWLDGVSKNTRTPLPGYAAHFIGNFHTDNRHTVKDNTMWLKDGYTVPNFPPGAFKDMDLAPYRQKTDEWVFEAWLRADRRSPAELRRLLRTTTKACLYLAQTTFLTQDGEYVPEYEEVIDRLGEGEAGPKEAETLRDAFSMRHDYSSSGAPDELVEQRAAQCLDVYRSMKI